MITVAIAEDNAKERTLLKNVIAALGHKLLFDAVDGRDILVKLGTAKVLPKILLLDVQMPYANGLDVTTYVNIKYPSIKIICISWHTNERLVKDIIGEGAKAFISKHFLTTNSAIYQDVIKGTNPLAEAIDSLQKGEIFIEKLLLNDIKKIQFSLSTSQIIAEKYRYLKPRLIEFAILNATNMPMEDIANILCVSVDTAKKYYQQLAKDFKVHTRDKLAKTCMENGIVKFATYFDNHAI
ncbi:MAG: response regulator [Flavobacterium sp.]|nr:response regulator [Flavobacterium sp.]